MVMELLHTFYQPFTTNARVTALSRAISRARKFHTSDLLIKSID